MSIYFWELIHKTKQKKPHTNTAASVSFNDVTSSFRLMDNGKNHLNHRSLKKTEKQTYQD